MTHQQILDAFDEKFTKDCLHCCGMGPNSSCEVSEETDKEILSSFKSFLLTHLKAERKAALQDAYWAARDKTDATEVAGEMLKAIHDLIDKLIGEGEDYPQQKVAVSRTTG